MRPLLARHAALVKNVVSLKLRCRSNLWTKFANNQGLHSVCTRCSVWIYLISSSADWLPLLIHVSVSYCELQSITLSYSPSVFPEYPCFPFDCKSLQCSSWFFLYSFIPGEEVSILHLKIQLKCFTFSVFLIYHSGLLHNCTLNVQVFSGNMFFCVWTVLCKFFLLLAVHGFVITHQVKHL